METIVCIDIPVQMISCTDTNGTITPLRFRFKNSDEELVTVKIDRVTASNQDTSTTGIQFDCEAEISGIKKSFQLRYSYYTREWKLSRIQFI